MLLTLKEPIMNLEHKTVFIIHNTWAAILGFAGIAGSEQVSPALLG